MSNISDVSESFATALEAGRSRYNGLFAVARMSNRRLDPEAFLTHLRGTVGPVVDAVHRNAPDRVTAVLDVLYDLSLDLVGRGWMGPGARFPVFDRGWQQALVALAPFLAREPRRLATAVTNALYHLAREPAADPDAWLDALPGIATSAADVSELLDGGAVLAWRCGMAHYRTAALAACARLRPAVAASALGLDALPDGVLPPLLDVLTHDPWQRPAEALELSGAPRLQFVRACGGFRGFGGLFLAPPRVAVHDGVFVAEDPDGRWALHADAFGAVFRRLGDAPNPTAADGRAPLTIDNRGTVRSGDRDARFPGLAGSSSAAALGNTLAVTLPDAHYVYLVALTPAHGNA